MGREWALKWISQWPVTWFSIGGIAFTGLIAILGYGLTKLPGFSHVGPLACAILLAVLYRQFFGYPETIRTGIQFSAKKLLRCAIILFGLKLNVEVLLHQGLGLLLRDAATILFSMIATAWIAKRMKADSSLSLILGIGTGVCGAAAIAAVAPILRSKEEDTAIAVGMIALIGTVFSVGYTLLRPLLPVSDQVYGIWAGVSLHEIAHVALAAEPAGSNALAVALLAKLGRVFLLVPLSFILLYWVKRKGKLEPETRIEFPWFLLGFIGMSLFGSYAAGELIPISQAWMNAITNLTTFLLTMAMVGLGLNVSLHDLRTKAFRPLAVMCITSLLLSVFTFFSVV